jgi:Ser/Thr protein kinase RdoA (MazF antagonist)
MRNETFPVIASVLSPTALAERVLPRYALSPPVRCRLVARGLSDTYRVEAGDTVAYLRVTPHGWRSRAEVEAEVAFAGELRRRGARVAAGIPRADGEYVTALAAPEGERFAVLFAAAGETAAPDITPRQAWAYGQLAATVHAAADASPAVYERFPIDERHLLDEPLATMRSVIGESEEMAFLERVALRVRRRLGDLPRSAPDYGLCHGDLHPGNVRFDTTGEPTLFDFDCCGYGWRAYDLTVFLWNAFGERRPRRWRDSRWRAFLSGYEAVRPLPSTLAETLPLFLVARQIWLMGIDCSGRGEWLPQWITPGWLREMTLPVRQWTAEYPILTD